MKNILPGVSPSIPVMIQVQNAEEFSDKPTEEEVILYDECGDTQWDKVLEQHDLADELNKVIRSK